MFGSDTLEVIAGIAFVFILLATICTAVREGIEAFLKTRASYLEYGIRELLGDRQGNGLTRAVFEHPLVFGLFAGDYTPQPTGQAPSLLRRGKNLPSYIPAQNFALALIDIAARGPVDRAASTPANVPVLSLSLLRQNLSSIDNPQVQRALLTAMDSAQGDLERVRANIERWYDSAMDRVSGWYKRSTQWLVFFIALFIACSLNVNTITVADYLYRHTAQRQALIQTIDKTATDSAVGSRYDAARKALDQLGLPIGWSLGWGAPTSFGERCPSPPSGSCKRLLWEDWIAPALGWLLTAFAATLGAPFWFDVLNQVMVIRSTVKPHEKSGEEASLDRQKRGAPKKEMIAAVARIPAGHEPADDFGDSCGVGAITGTPDQQLPPARGGVAA